MSAERTANRRSWTWLATAVAIGIVDTAWNLAVFGVNPLQDLLLLAAVVCAIRGAYWHGYSHALPKSELAAGLPPPDGHPQEAS